MPRYLMNCGDTPTLVCCENHAGHVGWKMSGRQGKATIMAESSPRRKTGQRGPGVSNLFTGLLRNTIDGSSMVMVNKGTHTPLPTLFSRVIKIPRNCHPKLRENKVRNPPINPRITYSLFLAIVFSIQTTSYGPERSCKSDSYTCSTVLAE